MSEGEGVQMRLRQIIREVFQKYQFVKLIQFSCLLQQIHEEIRN